MSDYLPHRRGQQGELVAITYLKEQGFTVVAKNYRYRRNEIDLIVRCDSLLVFVEVKLRKNASFGYPETFVTACQAKRITAAADQYIHETDWEGNIRFDIVTITLQPTVLVEHFKDAFH